VEDDMECLGIGWAPRGRLVRARPAPCAARGRNPADEDDLARLAVRPMLISDRIWKARSHLQLAVAEYIDQDRLHQALGEIPPAEMEAVYAPWTETNLSLEMRPSRHTGGGAMRRHAST
jgi:hypothetical protein